MGEVKLRLEELLVEKNITRYKLAQMTGIRYNTLGDYCKNKSKRYDAYILAKICAALECVPGDIIVYENN
jgi:putative transcriptional regulator